MPSPILGFTGKHRYLSNFFEGAAVTLEGEPYLYRTVEHAYQASKTLLPEWRARIRGMSTPGRAKRAAAAMPHRVDWPRVRLTVMRAVLAQKFSWPHLRCALLATGDRELVEFNHWGDTFWGVAREGDALVGENHLGQLLMELRHDFRVSARGEPTLIAFDLEATCWHPNDRPAAGIVAHEITEIGAVAWSPTLHGQRVHRFQSFVRPTEQPALSNYCRELTSISQFDVDGANTVDNVLPEFLTWCESLGRPLLVSWGKWDRQQLREECVRKGIPLPLIEARHVNAKARFASRQRLARQCGMAEAALRVGVTPASPAHRAIADAQTLVDILEGGLGETILRDHDCGPPISEPSTLRLSEQ